MGTLLGPCHPAIGSDPFLYNKKNVTNFFFLGDMLVLRAMLLDYNKKGGGIGKGFYHAVSDRML